MSRTIACLNCGVVLNLPENSEGRRLKCPKCGTKFKLEADGPEPIPSSPSSPTVITTQNLDGTILLDRKLSATNLPAASKSGSSQVPAAGKPRPGAQPGAGRSSSGDLPAMPTAAGDLRETFDLPMMTGSSGSGVAAGAPGARQAFDALALFDDKPLGRRLTAAEARAQTRVCTSCGGTVLAGTSLCQNCGFDLDTGANVGLMDDLLPKPPAPVRVTPIPVTIVGGACLAASVALMMLVLYQWVVVGAELAPYLMPLPLFGVYAAVKFLQGKSVRLLLAALTLGAVVDVVALIAMPIYDANKETTVEERAKQGKDGDGEDPEQYIRPISERLDQEKMWKGIALLVLYGGVSFYLLSPQVNRHFKK